MRLEARVGGAGADHCFQVPIACSTGASAREVRIEPAIIAPAGQLVLQRPARRRRRAAICSARRRNLEKASTMPARSLASTCCPSASFIVQPARDHARHHAHGLDRLGVAHRGLGPAHRVGRISTAVRSGFRVRSSFRTAKREQHDRAAERDHADQGVQQEDHEQIERHPGRVEQREDCRSGQNERSCRGPAEPRCGKGGRAGRGDAALEGRWASVCSIQRLTRTRMRERTSSSRPRTTTRRQAMIVRKTSVSWLCLASTRSNICSM